MCYFNIKGICCGFFVEEGIRIDMNEWLYVSENTIENISFHDCGCMHICFRNNRLVFEMEWLEILESHPQNPYREAHQSGESVVELIAPVLHNCEYTFGNQEIRVMNIAEVEFKNLTILDFNISKELDKWNAKIFMINVFGEEQYDNVLLEISFASSCIKFNELNGKSWFVNYED